MASNTVRVNVIGDSSQLQTAFDKGASSADRFKAQMGLVAKAAVAALAVKALGAVKNFVGDSVQAFSDLNESLNAVEVTYGDAAEGIKGLGEDAASSLGLSNAEFNSFAVQMSAFAHEIAGDGGDVVGVVDELSTRVSDFASVMNLEVNEAARLFQSGLAGETEPLRRYGIDLSAAAVQGHALATGIADGSGELTEQQKILARHSLLMEQTDKTAGDFANTIDDYANAQRVANAEMENSKARMGEALVPAAQLLTSFKMVAAEGVGVLATNLQAMLGQISQVDRAIQVFQISTGESADTAAGAATIVKEYGESFSDLLPRLNLSREELEKLQGAEEVLMEQHGFSQDQVEDLSDAVGLELASSLTDAEQATRDHFAANAEYEDGLGGVEDAAEDLNADLKTTNELLTDQLTAVSDLITPAFDYMENVTALADAQDAYNKAVEEFGENSPEAIAAAEDIAEANMGIQEAVVAIGEDGVPAAMEALKSMGVPPEVIQNFRDDRARIEEIFKNLVLRVGVTAPNLRAKPSEGGLGWESTSKTYYARGGFALDGPAPTGVFGEAGKETVLPLENQRGINVLAAAMQKAMGGGMGQPIYVTVNALDPQSAATAVVQALQTYQRSNGAVPITTR